MEKNNEISPPLITIVSADRHVAVTLNKYCLVSFDESSG